MARQLHRLSAIKVSKLLEPGQYPDGGGLYFQISKSGSRSWIFRFTLAGRCREMGLGALSIVSLAEARAKAHECRVLLHDRIDPIEARKVIRQAAAVSGPRPFRTAAADFIKNHRGSWKNKKHAQQWENTLATYVFPTLGDMDVREVDTPHLVTILQPIWTKKRETASRVRGRVESILDAEKALGHRKGDNPARWRGHLDKILPKQNKRKKVRHHPALPWRELPEFMVKLRSQAAGSARMLEHLILTCVRTQEVLFAQPGEFDFKAKLWTVPGDRMKMELPLRVPMTSRVIELAQGAIASQRGGWIYPGQKKDRPLSNMAMLTLLKRMGYGHVTVHGFRSTFRDWVAECTEHPGELAEMALAHAVENETERAYRRGDMLERRRKLMEDWERYCAGQGIVTAET